MLSVPSESGQMNVLTRTAPSRWHDNVGKDIRSLARAMTDLDPDSRPTIKEILAYITK